MYEYVHKHTCTNIMYVEVMCRAGMFQTIHFVQTLNPNFVQLLAQTLCVYMYKIYVKLHQMHYYLRSHCQDTT